MEKINRRKFQTVADVVDRGVRELRLEDLRDIFGADRVGKATGAPMPGGCCSRCDAPLMNVTPTNLAGGLSVVICADCQNDFHEAVVASEPYVNLTRASRDVQLALQKGGPVPRELDQVMAMATREMFGHARHWLRSDPSPDILRRVKK